MKIDDIFAPSVEVISDPAGQHRCAHLYDCTSRITQNGLILEFGVTFGFSARIIADMVKPRILYCFDWCKGSPCEMITSAGQTVPKGWGAVNPKDIYLFKNTELIVGDILNTLPIFLKGHSDPLAFCNIDVIVPETIKFILQQLTPRMQPGTILLFNSFIDPRRLKELEDFIVFREWQIATKIPFKFMSRAQYSYQVAVEVL